MDLYFLELGPVHCPFQGFQDKQDKMDSQQYTACHRPCDKQADLVLTGDKAVWCLPPTLKGLIGLHREMSPELTIYSKLTCFITS